jgi:cytochrome c biogenesis protein ResB
MKWEFQITEFLPQAIVKSRFVPLDLRPGLEVAGVQPAIRCRLTAGKDSKEFWVGWTDDGYTAQESVGGEEFRIGYNTVASDLGFEIKLLRAEETKDPGTNQPASYSSYVQLTDKKSGIEAQDRIIFMNHPLEHGGYKFFQSNLTPVRELLDDNGKPVNISGLTVSSDPGLWFKYIGSTMLALGIVCMFYMKAYFFKPSGRHTPAATPLANGQSA